MASTASPPKPRRIPNNKCSLDPFVYRHWHIHKFYHVVFANNSTIQFSCLTNYHVVSGNLRWNCLSNGSWSGTEPMCEVDFMKDKLTLSVIICVISFILPMAWLGTDFYKFVKKRQRVRNTKFCPMTEMRKNEIVLGTQHHIARKMSASFLRLALTASNLNAESDKEGLISRFIPSSGYAESAPNSQEQQESQKKVNFKFRTKYKHFGPINQLSPLGSHH